MIAYLSNLKYDYPILLELAFEIDALLETQQVSLRKVNSKIVWTLKHKWFRK